MLVFVQTGSLSGLSRGGYGGEVVPVGCATTFVPNLCIKQFRSEIYRTNKIGEEKTISTYY